MTRFVIIDLAGRSRALYEKIYCRLVSAENHIKAWMIYLPAVRTSTRMCYEGASGLRDATCTTGAGTALISGTLGQSGL